MNAVAPGFIRTDMFDHIRERNGQSESDIVESIPLQRVGEPTDVASAVAFLWCFSTLHHRANNQCQWWDFDAMKMPNTDFNLPANVQECSLAELELLADNVRTFLLDNISQTGGHIGANLGTIELTIALHHVFKSPEEPLLFDTGHQGYTHKLLTGRAKLFPSLNQYGGMNRFLTPSESEHDLIEASHAGTAISIGLGMALARKSQGDVRPVVAVVGDSAMAEGSSFEALNHAVAEETPLILVVNDNGYAISPGFGALHNVLSGPVNRARDFFESFGMRYFGPVDGHDIASLVEALQASREEGAMAIVHAKTIKGNGWKPSDNHPFRLHFSFPFDPVTGAPTSTSLALKLMLML